MVKPGAALSGAGAAVMAAALFTLNDTIVKLMSGGYPLAEVLLIWTLFSTAFLLGLVVPVTAGYQRLRTRRPLLHLARGGLIVVSNITFFLAVAAIPLAEAVAVFYVAPLLITLFSVLFLREPVNNAQWLAVAVGLAGVMMIAQPGTGTFRAVSLLPLVAALCYAVVQILTRVAGPTETAVTLSFYVQISFLVVGSLAGLMFGDGHLAGAAHPSVAFLLRPWFWPPMGDIRYFLALGLSSAIGGTLISQAYRIAPAALIAPFEYVALPLSLMWGVLVFGDWPNRVALAGIGLILVAGLLVLRWGGMPVLQAADAGPPG